MSVVAAAAMSNPWTAAGLAGASILAGIFGNRPRTTRSTWNKTDDSWSNATTDPDYDPLAGYFRDEIINNYLTDLNPEMSQNYWNAYEQNAFNNIDDATYNDGGIVNKFLTSRGLGRTTAGASAINNVFQNNRMQKAALSSSIPLLAEQRRRAILDSAGNFFRNIPYGQNTSTTGQTKETGSGTNINQGNMLGGGLAGAASSLALLYGANAGRT
jgi:hypothetical protein